MIGIQNISGADSGGRNWPTRGMPTEDRYKLHVFPHGVRYVRETFLRFVHEFHPGKFSRFISPTLESYRVKYGGGRPEEETEWELLNTKPWDRYPDRAPMPRGYYDDAVGSTHRWVEYYHWVESSPWGILRRWMEGPEKAKGAPDDPFLEVSCLTWNYPDMGDYETSLVIGLWRSSLWNSTIPLLHEHLLAAARTLVEQMSSYLTAHPPTQESVQKRQNHVQAKRRAQQEHQERIQHEQTDRERERVNRMAAEARRQETVARAQEIASHGPGRRVAVLYDTSYLMDGGRELIRSFWPIHAYPVISIIAAEVIAELDGHLRRPGTSQAMGASKARSRIVHLMERRDFGDEYREVQVGACVSPTVYPNAIGPISVPDSLLIEYGKYLLDHERYRAVVLASLDGGIRDIVFRHHQMTHQPLFCISDPKDRYQIEPLSQFIDRTAAMSSRIWAVSTDYDVNKDGVKGMLIQTNFSIAGCTGLPCRVIAVFTHADGAPLRDTNGEYNTRWGEVAVGCEVTPIADCVSCPDAWLFLPYDVLHLSPGTHDLKRRVGIFYPYSCLTWSADETFRLRWTVTFRGAAEPVSQWSASA